ncbi:serine/threonine-protein phosphatase 7 long form homolog [Dendrobium catenatum]|uniref:serine/threonine-protein phosphatase 7 long form homolog n=1 Tax=Dendrobium catenatum TaxID=906689 RepID=UPI00109F4D3A|nr:serine/threonine-protein phosphatase 7 long form homolog [Dendrobium catenatum]
MTPYTDDILATLPVECLEGIEIWRARVPLISWKRTEWYLPDRVMRQFGGIQFTDIPPMELNFRRIDGRGRADLDWTVQYRDYLEIWEDRRAYVVAITRPEGTGNQELRTYLWWYRSWASIYLLQPQTEPPETFFPRSPGERLVVRRNNIYF